MSEIEIISAIRAHELTKESIESDNECLGPIMNKIKEATKKKKYSCYISGATPDYIIQKLQILGYKTQYIKGDFRDPRETDIYEISW